MADVRLIRRYPGETLCPAVRDRYGDAPDRVPAAELLAYTGRAGLEMHRVRRHDDVAFDRFWYPAARVEVAVVAPYHVEEYGYRLGDVYSVTAVRYTVEPEWQEPVTAPAGK